MLSIVCSAFYGFIENPTDLSVGVSKANPHKAIGSIAIVMMVPIVEATPMAENTIPTTI
jgi:hypothetical protein